MYRPVHDHPRFRPNECAEHGQHVEQDRRLVGFGVLIESIHYVSGKAVKSHRFKHRPVRHGERLKGVFGTTVGSYHRSLPRVEDRPPVLDSPPAAPGVFVEQSGSACKHPPPRDLPALRTDAVGVTRASEARFTGPHGAPPSLCPVAVPANCRDWPPDTGCAYRP